MCKRAKIHTLFQGSSVTKTHHIGHKSTLILFFQICLRFLSIVVFYTKFLTKYTISVCRNFSPSVLFSHGFVAKNQKHYCNQFSIQRETMSLCTRKTVALHSADSGEFPHTESRKWLHDPSHRVQTITITILAARCSVHSFTDTHTLTHILLRQFNSNFSLTLYLRPTSLYTMHVNQRPINSVINL